MFKKINNNKNVICTAGIEYCYITAENKIYKCNAYYNDHLYEKSYNLKCYESFFNKENETCNHVSCLDRECDVYMVEIWNLKGKRINNKKIFWRNYSNGIKDVKKQKNLHIQLEPVFGCFHKCPYCALTQSKTTNIRHYIDMDIFLEMSKYIVKNFSGIKQFNIAGGGEPLLHPKINNLFNYCNLNNIEIFLVTSGLIDNDKYFKIANLFKNISVSLSLHPLSPYWKEHKIIELIDFLSKNAKHLNCRFVLYKENLNYLDYIKKLLKPYNICLIEMPYIDNLKITNQYEKLF